jgi:hypothetical protein
MPIFRIAMALGVLLVLAPEQTRGVIQSALGIANEAKDAARPAADMAQDWCKANPKACLELARKAADNMPGNPLRP